MRRSLVGLALVLVAVARVTIGSAQALDPGDVPPELRGWVPWVTNDLPTWGCTFASDDVRCAWPGELALDVAQTGATFVLQVSADRRFRVSLPGGFGQWPIDVRVDGAATPVIADPSGMPGVEVPPGDHRIEGRLVFHRRPDSVAVPQEVARVRLVAFGQPVPRVRRRADGHVLLDRATETVEQEQEQDRLSVEVYRRVVDGIPLSIETEIVVHVAGRGREVALGAVLPDDTTPSSVVSELPIRLDRRGQVVLQVRPGTHHARIVALRANPEAPLRAPTLPAPWPEQEVWVFAPDEMQRQVEIDGPPAVDPQRTSMPDEWKHGAAYLMAPGATLGFRVLRRGESSVAPNSLSVQREAWLALSGDGYSFVDQISGTIRTEFRLDLREGELGRVTMNGVDQLITTRELEGSPVSGVEVRQSNVSLRAESRLPGEVIDLPAVGWSEDVQSLSWNLHLPPGWSLLIASGADQASNEWVSRWDVGPLFFVLLISVIFARLFGVRAGVIALLTMVLVYDEPEAPEFIWLFVLLPVALLRTFGKGTGARIIYAVWLVPALVLLILSISFVTSQMRIALHPQLSTGEVASSDWGMALGAATERSVTPQAAPAPSSAAFEDADRYDEAPAEEAQSRGGMGGDGSAREGGSGRRNRYGAEPTAQALDPDVVVQTGYGIPTWSHAWVTLSWNGPVAHDHRVKLFVLAPLTTRVLALTRVLGVIVLLIVLFRGRPSFPPSSPTSAPPARVSSPSPAAVALALLACLGAGEARADDIPSRELLEELRGRLSRPPTCSPNCASIGRAEFEASGDRLRIDLWVDAAAQTGVPLPGPAAQWIPDRIAIDGRDTNAVVHAADGYLEARVPAGSHRVLLEGSLRGLAELALSFDLAPHGVTTRGQGWDLEGVDADGNLGASLLLRRQLRGESQETELTESTVDIPSWVELSRTLDIGVRWTLSSTLRRVSSSESPVIIRVPLLPNESITSGGIAVEGREALVSLGQGESSTTWTSVLEPASNIELRAPDAATRRTEVWTLACGPIWRCEWSGLDPVARVRDATYQPSFRPYPGEQLTFTFSRPEAAEGQATTVDSAHLSVSPGVRSTSSVLTISLRSSVSTTLPVTLPEEAQIERFTINGVERTVQREGAILEVPIAPGSTSIETTFREAHGIVPLFHTPRVQLGVAGVNATLEVNVPAERWLLFVSGPSWGPAILFWSHLALTLLFAFALSRVPRSPLSFGSWLLLALGLTQIPAALALLVPAWFFAVHVQHRRKLPPLAFNVAQVFLIGLTIVAAIVLLSSLWIGLTARPEMQVEGNGSSEMFLRWYVDRTTGALPEAAVLSVSVWVWKGLMLLWSAWLAAAVVRWAKWAVFPFRDRGFWEPLPKPTPPPAAPAASPPIAPPG